MSLNLNRIWRVVVAVAIAISLFLGTAPARAEKLPFPDKQFNGTIGKTYLDSQADDDILLGWQKAPPASAPNIMLVLLDDVGFGATSAFGGPVYTPTLESLASNGLSYNRFHTTSLCSPTRAALLTGRNHHTVSSGALQETSTGFPGYSGLIPQSTATIAQILQAHGYATGWFGKNHNVPDNQTSLLGPFDRWPNDLGFNYFYGFIGGETDQWYPTLYENRNPVDQPAYPEDGYNLTHDLADKAIEWVRYNHSMSPDTPFFLYFAPGAAHAPHQPPAEYIEKYKAGGVRAEAAGAENGMFVDGWDVERAAICHNQHAMGVIPRDAKCTERPDGIYAWDNPRFDYPSGYRDLLTIQMQTYAGFLEYADVEIGRVIDAIDELGEKDNTLIIYIVGDNGSSAEGSFFGTCNEYSVFAGVPLSKKENLECADKWGRPETYPHYAIGWAWAMDSPFRWTKQVGSYFGGIRNPMVISWPNGIQATGVRQEDLRDQFLHVIDITPTLLDLLDIEAPKKFNGITQKPIEGASFADTFDIDGENAVFSRDTQYFEMLAHRAIYQDGWMASAFHQPPWCLNCSTPILDDPWELFNLEKDFTQYYDLADMYPEKLEELKEVFDQQAREHDVYPLDDRFVGRLSLPRPTVIGDRTHFEFYEGAIHVPSGAAPNIANRSYQITADLNITDPEAVQGVILANGGTIGGYSLYVTPEHKLVYEYNYYNTDRSTITSEEARLPEGPVKVKFVFDYNNLCEEPSGCDYLGGTGALYVNDFTTPVAKGPIEKTSSGGRFGFDTQDVGMDLQAPVSDTYQPPFEFTGGKIEKVTIDLGDVVPPVQFFIPSE